MRSQKEQFLLHRIRRLQDQQAFAELIKPYASGTYRILRSKLPEADDADDAYNTTLLRTWNYLVKAPEVQNVGGLIFTIARSVISEFYQTRKPATVPIDTDDNAPFQVPDKGAEDRVTTDAEQVFVHKALNRLKDEYREVITLKYLEELSAREIAKRMEMSEGAARMLLHRALRALRDQFE